MLRYFLIVGCLILASCQTDEVDMAQRRAALDADQDAKCQSFGAKKGSSEYIHCRETLYTQARQEDAQRRQLAAAYILSRPMQQPLQTPKLQQSVNCTSMRNGVMLNTTCY